MTKEMDRYQEVLGWLDDDNGSSKAFSFQSPSSVSRLFRKDSGIAVSTMPNQLVDMHGDAAPER